MTQKEFNYKYKLFIPEGWYGLEFDIDRVTDYLDRVMQDMVRIPGFQLHQIKLKFGKARFYFETQFFNKQLELSLQQTIEEEVNKLYRGYDKWSDTAKLKVEANSAYNDGWTREHYEKELNKRMDVIGQNGNEGLHYEEDWMDKEYKEEYEKTLKSGMFFEWYPNLTGEWDKDKYAFIHDRKFMQNKNK